MYIVHKTFIAVLVSLVAKFVINQLKDVTDKVRVTRDTKVIFLVRVLVVDQAAVIVLKRKSHCVLIEVVVFIKHAGDMNPRHVCFIAFSDTLFEFF